MSTTKQEARQALRGVEVRLLDLSSIEQRATTWAREHIPDRVGPNTTLEVGFKPWGLFTAANGETVLVCIEGVGYHVTDDDDTTAHLGFYTHEVDPDSANTTRVGMMPVASRTVTIAELAEVDTGDTVDLADHVRIFGERLEDNLRAMHRLATDRDHADEYLTTE